jgi:hypothetical protein
MTIQEHIHMAKTILHRLVQIFVIGPASCAAIIALTLFMVSGASLQDGLHGVLKEADAAYRGAPAGMVLVSACENGKPAGESLSATSLSELKETPLCNAVLKTVSPNEVVEEWDNVLTLYYKIMSLFTVLALLMTLGWPRFIGRPDQSTPSTLGVSNQV